MGAIFISYRREDSEGHAGRLFEDLVARFGKDSVFMDVTGIEPGRDFRKVIDSKVGTCGVLLAVIGKTWLSVKDESDARRIDNPTDFVRMETISALNRDIPVIPVLVHGAVMPRADELPPELSELAFRNGVELTHARWESDIQVLLQALQTYVRDQQRNNSQPAATETRHMTDKFNATASQVIGSPLPPQRALSKKAIAAIICAVMIVLSATIVGESSDRAAQQQAMAAIALEQQNNLEQLRADQQLAEEQAAQQLFQREANAQTPLRNLRP
jgi:hypothetical protein